MVNFDFGANSDFGRIFLVKYQIVATREMWSPQKL